MEQRELKSGRNEEQLVWKDWNKLGNITVQPEKNEQLENKLMNYYPGRFLQPFERVKYKFCQTSRIALIGLRGNGKSAFINTCELILNLNATWSIQGQSEKSFTAHSSKHHIVSKPYLFGKGIELIDCEGLVNFGDAQTQEFMKDVNWKDKGTFDQIAEYIGLSKAKIHLDIDACIIVWDGTQDIRDLERLEQLIKKIQAIFEANPVVLVTKFDQFQEKNISQTETAQMINNMRGYPKFISNYTGAENNGGNGATNQNTNQTALEVLQMALQQADALPKVLQTGNKNSCIIL